jgi:hypothetical protein
VWSALPSHARSPARSRPKRQDSIEQHQPFHRPRNRGGRAKAAVALADGIVERAVLEVEEVRA